MPVPTSRHDSWPLLAATSFVVPAVAATPVAGAKPLKKGSHGVRVKVLQRDLGLSPADGIFGHGHLQGRAQVPAQPPPDGRRHRRHGHVAPGPPVARAARPRRRATHGVKVAGPRLVGRAAAAQAGHRRRRRLRPRDGAARSRRFQRAHGLTADGVVGPAPGAALGVAGRHPVLKRAHLRGGGGVAVPRHVILLRRAVAAANRIQFKPYIYGGGHGSFSAAGYDCSGSVSYVLHGMGRLGRPDGLRRADVLRQGRARAASSRSTRTPATRSWSSTAAATTPACARPTARAGARACARPPATSRATPSGL